MFAKMVLPVLGGSPSVWAVAVFFFQAALLAGYCYAHLLIAKVPAHMTGLIHLGVCLAGRWCACRSGCRAAGASRRRASPTCGSSACSRWRSACRSWRCPPTRRCCRRGSRAPAIRTARDPYFLYAASNLGSLIALLGYPFVLEPAFGLKALSRLLGHRLPAADRGAWRRVPPDARSAGGDRQRAGAPAATAAAEDAAAAPTWPDRLGWVGLALVPSALLTAFTTHVTTDVASAPLLWVLPLALYLLTFVLVFRDRPLIPRQVLLFLHLIAVAVALLGAVADQARELVRDGADGRRRVLHRRPWWRTARCTRRGRRRAT